VCQATFAFLKFDIFKDSILIGNSGVAKRGRGGRSASGGTVGFSVSYKPVLLYLNNTGFNQNRRQKVGELCLSAGGFAFVRMA